MTIRVDEKARERGFTLIELLVAMTVTLIITGAMYGLLAGGQNAFRREPELTDRQQAIRLGMDRIQRDLLVAGQALGVWAPVFTAGGNDTGPMTGPNGPTDVLEMLAASGSCPSVPAQRVPASEQLAPFLPLPSCYRDEQPVMLMYPNGAKPVWGHQLQSGGNLDFGVSGQLPTGFSAVADPTDFECALPFPAAGACTLQEDPTGLGHMSVVRYVIAPDADGFPALWRTDLGGFNNTSGARELDPATAGADAGWRIVARGVEDLQVRYRTGNGWFDEPQDVVAAFPALDYSTVVREVRITLGARTFTSDLAGARSVAVGEDALRGQLVATVSPRAPLFYLALADVNIYE